MASPFLAAVIATIVPAMGALWFLLKRYEEYFEDARVFFSLVVGFFVGLVASVFEVMLFPFWGEEFITDGGVLRAFLFFVAGFAFFEAGCKVMVMGLRRFRGRRDTPYYGAAAGLGFGGMAGLAYLSFFGLSGLAAAGASGLGGGLLFVLFALVPIGGVFVHGATGAWVGLGSARSRLWWGWGIATVLQAPVLVCYWLLIRPVPGFGASRVVAGVAAVAYGVFLLEWTKRRVLDQVVPPEIQAKVRRARRRELREALRRTEGDPPQE